MKDRLAKKEIQQGGDVGLDHEEEELFGGDIKECRPNDGIGRVAPDTGADEVGIPWCRGDDCDLGGISICLCHRVWGVDYADEKEDFVQVESCTERAVTPAQRHRWGDCVQ